MDPCVGVGRAPGERGQRPEKHLEVRACESNPEAFGFFWKEPGIADVAIESRLKTEQQKAHLVHLTAKVFASEAMSELVRGDDKKDNRQQQRQGRELVKSRNVLNDFAPAKNAQTYRGHNQAR